MVCFYRLRKNTSFVKNGKYKNGLQRYHCRVVDCSRSFSILTNTIFDNHKISISEWIEFLLYLFGYDLSKKYQKVIKTALQQPNIGLKSYF